MENRYSGNLAPLLPGVGLAVAIAVVTHAVSWGHAALDPLVLSILLSIVIGNLIGDSRRLDPGTALARRVFIPLGIVLYGTQMDLAPLRIYGVGRLIHVILVVLVGLAAIYWLSARLGIARKLSMLLAAGSAICGASAVMVLSPVIAAEKEETSVSLLALTVVGLTGVILYPLLQEIKPLSDEVYALLCGTTLNQMGQVRAAAAALGTNVLTLAISVKLLRIGMLLPIAIAYSLLTGRQGRAVYIPWFIVGSIIAAVLFNLSPLLREGRADIAPFGTFFFSIAISGIGLSVNIESIIAAGPKPLISAFLGWLMLIALFFLGLVWMT